MKNPAYLANEIIEKPYAWPGGYPMYAITDDGGVLCKTCCKTELPRIQEADPGDGFHIEALTVNWEDPDLCCDHCGNAIESAYGDDSSE